MKNKDALGVFVFAVANFEEEIQEIGSSLHGTKKRDVYQKIK